jgi:hypothetical protein
MVGWESDGRDGQTISFSGSATLDVRKRTDHVAWNDSSLRASVTAFHRPIAQTMVCTLREGLPEAVGVGEPPRMARRLL